MMIIDEQPDTSGNQSVPVEAGQEKVSPIRNSARGGARLLPRLGGDLVPGGPVAVSGSGTTPRDRFVAWVLSVARRARECAPYSGRPRSVRAVVEYTARGGWVPGAHHWLVEFPGYVYGCAVAIPLTIVAHATQWAGSRLPRAVAMAGLYGLLVWLAPEWVEFSWWRAAGAWGALVALSIALVFATVTARGASTSDQN